jgi:predicted Zn finger-like uncharacterized protein
MLVQCPNCKTTYKVSDEVLKGAAPAFRCSRCRHTFELEAEPPEETEAADNQETAESEAADQELSFTFAPPTPEPEPKTEDAGLTTEHHDQPTAANEAAAGDAKQWTMPESEAKEETPYTLPRSNQPPEPEKVIDEAEDFPGAEAPFQHQMGDLEAESPDNILPISSYRDQQASILPFTTLLVILVIVYSLITVISYAHPKASENLVKGIPLFGTSVLKNSHLKDGILIQSVHGGFQTIQGNREVFVITGVAVNQNPSVVREIQITGKVYNDLGKEVEQQTVWLGNTLSAKIIRDMTTEDIPHLQNLKPLKSFEMPPGDSIPFAIVFLKSTKTAKNFTCEISLAAGEA